MSELLNNYPPNNETPNFEVASKEHIRNVIDSHGQEPIFFEQTYSQSSDSYVETADSSYDRKHRGAQILITCNESFGALPTQHIYDDIIEAINPIATTIQQYARDADGLYFRLSDKRWLLVERLEKEELRQNIYLTTVSHSDVEALQLLDEDDTLQYESNDSNEKLTDDIYLAHNILGAILNNLAYQAPSATVTHTEPTLSTELVTTTTEKKAEPKITFDDIVGYAHEKDQLKKAAALFTNRELATSLGLVTNQNILLHGEPGTGKSSLAEALANELKAHIHRLNSSDVIEKWVGASGKNIAKFFDDISYDAYKDPSELHVVLMDEFDSLARSKAGDSTSERHDVLNLLKKYLVQIQIDNPNVMIIATTNHYDSIDPAITRPGRFQSIEVRRPDEQTRKMMLFQKLAEISLLALPAIGNNTHLPTLPQSKDIDIDQLAISSEGLTGAHFAEMFDNIKRERIYQFDATRRNAPDNNLSTPTELEPITHTELLRYIRDYRLQSEN